MSECDVCPTDALVWFPAPAGVVYACADHAMAAECVARAERRMIDDE